MTRDAVRCDLLPISGLTPGELTAWRELAAGAVVPNPFLEPAFVLAATRCWQTDDVHVLVVRAGAGADWLAALPVRQVRTWRGVPGRCLVGWHHDYCYLGTPLVTGDEPQATLAALIDGGLDAGGCLALDWVDDDGPLCEPLSTALDEVSRPVHLERFERAALHRRESDDYVAQALGARHSRDYRRKLRLLRDEVGELELVDESEDPAATERFLALERSGWKGEVGTAMACRPGHSAFFAEVTEAFARDGRFTMLSLASEQGAVAMRNELLAGDTSFTFKIAFDERFARFSPGIQLEIAAIERFHAGGLRWSDSCTAADNKTLNRLWVGRRRLRSVVATSRRPLGTVDYAKWQAATAAAPLRRRLRPAPAGLRGH